MIRLHKAQRIYLWNNNLIGTFLKKNITFKSFLFKILIQKKVKFEGIKEKRVKERKKPLSVIKIIDSFKNLF